MKRPFHGPLTDARYKRIEAARNSTRPKVDILSKLPRIKGNKASCAQIGRKIYIYRNNVILAHLLIGDDYSPWMVLDLVTFFNTMRLSKTHKVDFEYLNLQNKNLQDIMNKGDGNDGNSESNS